MKSRPIIQCNDDGVSSSLSQREQQKRRKRINRHSSFMMMTLISILSIIIINPTTVMSFSILPTTTQRSLSTMMMPSSSKQQRSSSTTHLNGVLDPFISFFWRNKNDKNNDDDDDVELSGEAAAAFRERWSQRRKREILYTRSAVSNAVTFMLPKDSRLEVTEGPPSSSTLINNNNIANNNNNNINNNNNNDVNGILTTVEDNEASLLLQRIRQGGPSQQQQFNGYNGYNMNNNGMNDPSTTTRRSKDTLWDTNRGTSSKLSSKNKNKFNFNTRIRLSLNSIGRVIVPSLLAAALGISYYDNLSCYINENWLDAGAIQFLSSDEIQFIPSFLTVISLLFSILAGNAFSSLYDQQETIYFALYREVSEAKSLLEQMTLVCSGRPFYQDALQAMKIYISSDLKRVDVPPADLISRSPAQDPLEAIMYLTSVGVPSVIYETVRDLRQARGYRLGAMQRKFPRLGIALLWVLAILELAAFPLLGAGTAVGAPQSIFNVQGALFGGLCGATTLVLRIIQELWRTSGGTFNVDPILNKMVKGLSEELDVRAQQNLAGTAAAAAVPRNNINNNNNGLRMMMQAASPSPQQNWNNNNPQKNGASVNSYGDGMQELYNTNNNGAPYNNNNNNNNVEQLLLRVEELENQLQQQQSSSFQEGQQIDNNSNNDKLSSSSSLKEEEMKITSQEITPVNGDNNNYYSSSSSYTLNTNNNNYNDGTNNNNKNSRIHKLWTKLKRRQ